MKGGTAEEAQSQRRYRKGRKKAAEEDHRGQRHDLGLDGVYLKRSQVILNSARPRRNKNKQKGKSTLSAGKK